jgi:hypothetical protein
MAEGITIRREHDRLMSNHRCYLQTDRGCGQSRTGVDSTRSRLASLYQKMLACYTRVIAPPEAAAHFTPWKCVDSDREKGFRGPGAIFWDVTGANDLVLTTT